jgi:hypothetical protein
VAAALVVLLPGCGHDTSGLGLAPGNTDPVVFLDTYGDGVGYQAFAGSKVTAVTVDASTSHQGTSSLKVSIPNPSDPAGGYAGGAFTTVQARDPSGYNALTFWAKASRTATLDIAGLGNDNTGNSKYTVSWSAIPVTTTWKKYVIPIPLTGVLRAERGMFFFAEGPEAGAGYTLWFDDIVFEYLDDISNPRPSLASRFVGAFAGASFPVQGTRTTFSVGGTDQAGDHFPAWFTYASSNDTVATATEGIVRVHAPGRAEITGALGTMSATGVLTVNAAGLPPEGAPVPTVPAADVISLFSNSYVNRPVDKWSADWDLADVSDVKIAGNDAKAYTNLTYAGIEFISQTVDATAMTHFHLDAWASGGAIIRIKLVDFGADGVYGGGDDREQELSFNGGTTPAFRSGVWSSMEIPLASFAGLTTRGHVAQLIISCDASTLFIDNIYFHR